MKAMFMILFAAIGVAVAMAQTNPSQYHPSGGTAPSTYQPAVPVAPQVYGGGSTYGGWGYGGGGAAGGGALTGAAMQGMASVVNAKGNYNLFDLGRCHEHDAGAEAGDPELVEFHQHLLRFARHQPQGSGRRTGEEPNRRTAQPHRPGRCRRNRSPRNKWTRCRAELRGPTRSNSTRSGSTRRRWKRLSSSAPNMAPCRGKKCKMFRLPPTPCSMTLRA